MSANPSTRAATSPGADAVAVRKRSPQLTPAGASALAALHLGWRDAQGQARARAAAGCDDSDVCSCGFTYLFGGAISGSRWYLEYISRGSGDVGAFTTVYSGVALNTDDQRGGRPLSPLPIWRPAPLVGSLLGDSVRYVIAGTVIIVLGVILGYRPGAGVGGAVAALALVVLFAFGLSWVFTTLGLLLRTPNAVMNAGFMGIFPLTFLSNVFVTDTCLDSGLRRRQPDLDLATASRGLMEATPTTRTSRCACVAAGDAGVRPLTTRSYYRSVRARRCRPEASG